ncbi:chemotaxis response regulator protein-glutamate methylesterase [Falsihalocynthiibacter sp. SS001]|uniref:protein-glutamate methylesterase/protein-glutamine glutaminase n=1 Tax=Falsihalocynthiibacter sp. SS001 TaxID=3349698 RepID=UPI0036D20E9B
MSIPTIPHRVLIVDDSSFYRQALKIILSKDPRLEVVGSACDAFQAKRMVDELAPDVITLDVEMPKVDGLEFLRRLMAHRPTPVVMCSTIATKGSDVLMRALESGAVGVIEKGRVGSGRHAADIQMQICDTVRGAALAKVKPLVATPTIFGEPSSRKPSQLRRNKSGISVLGIGASTGGTEAIKSVLLGMSEDCPPVVIVQHMPKSFTGPFAERLNNYAPMEVREARDGDILTPGLALLSPGSHHMEVARGPTLAGEYRISLSEGPLVSRHRPSVDVLFRSMARVVGRKGCGVILTGMGQDGADGLLEMRKAGARTYGQDQDTCVVYGMSKMAHKAGAVQRELPLHEIAEVVMSKPEEDQPNA